MKAFYLIFLLAGALCAAQNPMPLGPSVPLATLVEEAQQKNPEIQAATHGAQAASHAAKQVGALPDTQSCCST